MVIIASTANTNIHQLQNFNSQNNNNNNNNNLFHDASFSSYLNEGTFAESSKNFNTLISSNRKDHIHHGINKEEDGEIGVFAAEKYFSGGGREEVILSPRVSEIDSKKYHNYQKEEQTVLETGRYKGSNKYGTPSGRSESSWNSQSALLQNSMMRESSRNKNKSQRKSFLAGLGCKCSCSDKNSVDVSDHAGDVSYNNKTSAFCLDHGKTGPKKHLNADLDSNHSVRTTKQHHKELKDVYFQKQEKVLGVGLNRENGLQFSAVKMQIQELEKPKKSLEVFGSPILESRSSSNNKSMSFDKRLAMPNSWDGPPKLDDEIDITENSGGGGNYNDSDSDASSDLFEIESLTGKSNNPFLSRPISSCDVASGCASPTNCYAPSEVSIEWSVVTASAVEYSAMSDYDDQRSVATIRSPIRPPLPSSNGKLKGNMKETTPRRRHPGILLGCKSQKAVGVAADAFTTCEKPSTNRQIRRRSDTFSQVTRFQTEVKEASFGARHGQYGYANIAAPPLQRSHSPHASQLLYI